MNRWYPYESHAEQWRVHRKNILIIVWAGLINLGLGIWDLVTDHWEFSIVLFITALGVAWTALGVILNSGTWLKPWLPYSEKPEVKQKLENLRMLEGAVRAHEEQRRAAEARES